MPGKWIRSDERAAIVRLLETTELSMTEIAKRVGRSDDAVGRINAKARIRQHDPTRHFFRFADGREVRIVPLKTFDDFVERRGEHWIWKGNLHPEGYPRVMSGDSQKWLYAAHVAWERERGPIPDGVILVRQCRASRCVAPDHHRLMTQAERIQRSRSATLTFGDVERIRDSAKPASVIALKYGVSRRQVNRIRQGTRWRQN